MKSSYNTTVTTETNHHHSHQQLSWSSHPFPSSRSFVPAAPSSPSSTHARGDPAGQLVFPKLPHHKISVRLAANLDKNTTSSSYKAEVSTHKRSAECHIDSSSDLSSDSDFEFDSCCLSDVNHDGPPVSPKLICPSTAYNYSRGLHNKERSEVIMQKINPLPSPPPYTPVINARRKSSSAPPSPSTGQLMAEELSGDYKGYDLDYYSPSAAPQTPNLQKKQEGQLLKQRPGKDNSSLRGTNINEYQTRSKGAVWDRRAFIMDLPSLAMQKQVDLTGGLEHNFHLQSSSSSLSNGSSAAAHAMGINELFDQEKYTRMKSIQKHRSSNSNKKCTFQDLLGWTVDPISRALDPHANPNFESPRQSTSSSIRSSPKPHYLLSRYISSSSSTPAAVKHVPTLAAGRPSPTSRSSPRPAAISPHALLYKQQKAQSNELRKKTFLPYRQSLLGC